MYANGPSWRRDRSNEVTKPMRIAFVSLAILSATAAASEAPAAAAPGVRVHTYTAASRSYDANAFWLESEQGLVLIDALLLRSDARLLAAAMKATGKPLAGILLTHPHLDHFGGLRTVVSAFGKVPVYATRATAEAIEPTHDKAMADGWPQAYGADYDPVPYVPDRIIASGTTLELAGMRFEVRDYGPMEAANNSVVHNLDLNVLFTGDATVFHAGVYVGEGRSRQILDVLDALGRDFATVRRVYSGHYAPAALAPLIAQNAEDVRHYRDVVAAQLLDATSVTEKGALTEAARTRAARAIAMRMREGATYGLDAMTLAQMNLGGLEPEMRDEIKKRQPQEAWRALQEGLRKVDFVIGRWAGPLAVLPAPGGAASVAAKSAQPGASVVRFAPGPGARYFEGEARVGAFGYRMLLSYDVVQKQYRFSSIDDVSGLLDVYEGDFNSSGALVVSNVKSGTHYRTAATIVHNRLTFQPLPGDVWEWRIEGSTDGGRTWVHSQTFAAARRLP
jgi:glyoxylase-like metal-dependent hydrolase (beta-lactamase superfamily II)